MRIAALAAALMLVAAPAAAEDLEGEWQAPDGAARARLAACPDRPGLLCGVVAWLDPVGAKAAPLLKIFRIWGLRQAAPGRWRGGKLHDPALGLTYDVRLSANADGTLRVESCLKLFCQSQTWKRS